MNPKRAWRPFHRLARLALLIAFAAVTGCTVEDPSAKGPKGPRLAPVSGVVRVDGKPLEGAVVAFLPTFSETGTQSVGGTDAAGRYELAYLGQAGTAPGEYRVIVSYMVGANGKVADLAARSGIVIPDEVNTGRELLPARYSDGSRTELRATVGASGLTLDLDLKGPLAEPPKPRDAAAPPSGDAIKAPAPEAGPAPKGA